MKEMIQSYAEPSLGWRQVVPFLGVVLFNATCNLKTKNTPICKPQTQPFFFFHIPLNILSKLDQVTFKDTELVPKLSTLCFRVITSLCMHPFVSGLRN